MDCIILINKPKGCTSHDIVYKAKKILNEKVGHTGTLDPNATGVLPLLVGKGTKVSKYLINHDKTYEAVLKLGIKTDTADIEGNILEEKEVSKEILQKCNIEKVLKEFIGKQEQLPPIYSSIKVNGKKLYEYARKGEKIELQPRNIEIYGIQLLNINEEENEIEFRVSCSKGTYIRSLCENIAEKLNTVGYMKELKRTVVGDFCIDDTVLIDELENIIDKNKVNRAIIKIEDLFRDKNEIILNNKELRLFLNGVKLEKSLSNGIYKIYDECKNFIGIGNILNKILKREIIL